MYEEKDCFLSRSYKGGYIDTCYNRSQKREEITAQYGDLSQACNTFKGARRAITRWTNEGGEKMKKTAAVIQTRGEVSALFGYSKNSYTFRTWNSEKKAWQEGWFSDFYSARARRSDWMIARANELLGIDENRPFMGGSWVDYVGGEK